MVSLRLVALVALAAAVPASATTMYETETRCPVGGKTFKHMAIGSYSTFGELPDGMPVGTGPFPMPIPECPDNGLVLYRDFDAAEVTRLTPVVLSAEYQAMRARDTPSRRMWWLATHLSDKKELPWMLLAATWEAKAEPKDQARIVRYQEDFVAAARAEPVDAHDFASVILRGRAANALRELARFDEAEQLRASIVIADDAGKGEDDAARTRAGLSTYLIGLGVAIARHDPSRTPIDMSGERQAAMRCAGAVVPRLAEGEPPLTPFETSYCARPEIKVITAIIVKANASSE